MKQNLPGRLEGSTPQVESREATQGIREVSVVVINVFQRGLVFLGLACPSVCPEARLQPAPEGGSSWREPGTLQSILGCWPGQCNERVLETMSVTGLDP